MRLGFGARLALSFGLLWALLWGLGVGLGALAVDRGLKSYLARQLLADAAKVARFYREGETGQVTATGGTEITLYDYQGTPILPPDPLYPVPPEVVEKAPAAPALYRGPGFLAAYADAGVGVIAVAQGTGVARALARGTARVLAGLFFVGLVLGGAAVLLLSRRASAPLVAAAEEVASRGWDDLAPIPYRGPDDELSRIVHRFNALLAELARAKARERDFLNEVAHELFTPMTVLLAEVERGDCAAARASARHLTRLAEDLLALARGASERDLELHITDLGEVVAGVTAAFPGVHLVRPARPVEALADPDRLAQLVRNLVQNAVRAAGAENVTVGVEEDERGPRLWVRDTGPGIPPELKARLFERYTKGRGGRLGLGLAIAKQIAEAHGGEIRVRSQPGETVFEVRLPGLEEE